MHMKKISLYAVALTTSVILSACGGGGGGDSSSGTTPVSPVIPPAVTQNLQAAATPTYSQTSEEYGYFTVINAFRTSQGLGPLNQNPAYDKAAAAHAAYIDINGLSHGETAGLTGFTGATPLARVQYQGGTATAVEEEAGSPDTQGCGITGQGANFASVLINTVYHRTEILFQGVTDIGTSIGVWDCKSAILPSSVSEMGYVNQQVNAGTYFGAYPVDGQTGISLHIHAESPSPIPPGADFNTYGSPISVASQESTTLNVTSFTVTQAGSSTPLPATIITDSDPNLAGSTNLAFLLPSQAYLPNTTYTVNFVGTITGTATGTANGIPVNKTWSFTTGTTSN